LTSIEIKLDKDAYLKGDKVKGKFKLTHGEFFWEGPTKVKIYLEAKGEENVEVLEKKIVETTDPSTGQTTKQEEITKHYASDTFFKKPLSYQVRNSLGTPTGNGLVTIDKGTKEASFEFTLEADKELFQSYEGSAAKILYYVTGVVDKEGLFDTRREFTFKVATKSTAVGQPNKVNAISKGNLMTLSLEAEKDIYARGDVIKGKVTLDNPAKRNIAGLYIGIRSIERALAEGFSSEVPKESHTQPISGNWNVGDSRTFQLKIPENLTPTYQATNSEYYWEIIARADTASNFAQDLFTVERITIA
jgi:hypothetical protein